MVVPPLVLTTILESKSLSPAVLIPALSSKFQGFDRTSSNVKACTILRPVLEYLWAVYHKKSSFNSYRFRPEFRGKRVVRENAFGKHSTSSLTDRTPSSFRSPTSTRFKSTTGSIIIDRWRTPPAQRCARKMGKITRGGSTNESQTFSYLR